MLMILARLVRSESFWAVVKVRSPHTGPEFGYPRKSTSKFAAAPRNLLIKICGGPDRNLYFGQVRASSNFHFTLTR